MSFWARASSNAFYNTLPHFKGKSRSAIVFSLLRSVIIYAIAFIIIKWRLGSSQVIEEGTIQISFVLALLAVLIFLFLWNLLLAPSRMEKDMLDKHQEEVERLTNDFHQKEQRLAILEEEHIPKFTVKSIVGKRTQYEQNELTSWAELEVKNTSSVDLPNVNVKISELMNVYEKTDKNGIGTGIYHLREPYPKWSPANVYWSGRTGSSRQFSRPINRNETQYATIAFHHEIGNLGEFNILTHPPMLESRIVIEVSSPRLSLP